ncbi:thiosulfate oxidation carrier complex protein SoxZ [Brachymonas denitrificans]|uniref:thiosulfate oxidation carrier complex protein SoxZ n=1 Tax=Brachymonas denitrificans TaxID=28220 RepID=UPI001BCC9501|nr:thiosulfate oxidation carrier complex protein SoxZ [Brachymonas denitrificans]
MIKPPRIWISNATPAKGERVRVRAQVTHRMETGLRNDDGGKAILRNIVNRFEASLGGQPLFEWNPQISVAIDPYIEFVFVADKSGTLNMVWTDDAGTKQTAARDVTVAG